MESRQLRLDLHTHIFEVSGYKQPTPEIVREVVNIARSRGLDGIAITAHHYPDSAFRFKALADDVLDDHFLIIPGQEIDQYNRHRQIVELYLPNDITFRFLAHPGSPASNLDGDLSDLHGIEIENSVHDGHIGKERVRKIAQETGLLLLSVSDAHYLSQIGRHHTVISLEDLHRRAAKA